MGHDGASNYEDWGVNDPSTWDEGKLSLMRNLGSVLIYLYVFVLGAVFLNRIRSRKASAPMKPWLTCFLDTILEVPSLMKVGPWGRDNSIMVALDAAMAETKLADFGLDGEGEGEGEGNPNTKDNHNNKKKSTAAGAKDPYGFVERYDASCKKGIMKIKAKYSPLGYLLSYRTIHRRMVTRLRHVDYMKKHPNVGRIPVKKPVFVIGFPRTGTTFLHEMLTVHKKVRTHYTWEQYDHVPGTDSESCVALREDRRKRYTANKGTFNTTMKIIGDDIQSIHRIGYDDPEECTTPCAFELPYAIGALPLYILAAKDVLPMGCGKAFEFYKEYLQMITWQSRGEVDGLQVGEKVFDHIPRAEEAKVDSNMQQRPESLEGDMRWMLKCPFHLPYLEELFETFPDATVVWTHRDPVECIASACSLYYTLGTMALEVDSIDKKALGRAVMEYTKLSLDKAHETIEKLKGKGRGGHVIHIRYQDNVKDPNGTVNGIMREVGLVNNQEEAESYKRSLDSYLARNKAFNDKTKSKKGGGHRYTLDEYGLTDDEVRRVFRSYTDKYRLCEK
jgi:hypothetical protein